MQKLFKKIREKISEFTSGKDKKTAKPVKKDAWQDRKKELLKNVRSSDEPVKKEIKSRPAADVKSKPAADLRSKPPVKENQPTPAQNRERNYNQRSRYKKSTGEDNVQRRRPSAPAVPPKEANEVKPEKVKWDPALFNVEPVEGKKRFQDFDLPEELMHAIYDLGFKYCTPIQAEILSKTLAGKDASGKAQTGTGKTAAFLITIFSNFLKSPEFKGKPGAPRALTLAPTRELVMQIASDAAGLSKYTSLKTAPIVGGMQYQKQQQLLSQPTDIVVATPGRLLDFYSKRILNLSEVEILVIDEADRMMDMGFIPDMRKIVRATPHKDKRQTLLFSATLTDNIMRLASSWTKDAELVNIEPDQVAGKNVEQIVYIVSADEKYALVYNTIIQKNLSRVIVFTNRKDEAKKLKDLLFTQGINTALLSGDIDQRKRIKTLQDFKDGKINILVATDVAGRGIHIEGISHVINFNLPEDPEDYVHRIGRTGRAGADGISISFACEDDSFNIPAIEKYIGNKLELTYPDENLLKEPPVPVRTAEKEIEAKERPPQPKKRFNPNYHNRKR